jgi:hypothetical protein
MTISRRDFEGNINSIFDWFDYGEGLNFWMLGKVRTVVIAILTSLNRKGLLLIC